MNRAQEILIKLFDEINIICRNNDLPLFLFSNTALSAYKENRFEGARYEIDVAMLWKDAVRLNSIIQKKQPDGRKIESLFTNPDFRTLAFRYVDTETTYINKRYNIRAKELGLCVNILPLFSNECERIGEKRFRERKIEEGFVKALGEKLSRDQIRRKKRPVTEGINLLREGGSLGSSSKSFLDAITSIQKDATLSDTLYFRKFSSLKKIVFPKGIFSDTIRVRFEPLIAIPS